MGAWGYESDANDSTHDLLLENFEGRLESCELTDEGKKIYYEKLKKENPQALSDVGVIMWMIKQGCKIPDGELLGKTLLQLTKEFINLHKGINESGWFKLELRKTAITHEIKMIGDCLLNDCQLQNSPGTKGLIETILGKAN